MPSRFRVVWTESASVDLTDIIRYIARDSPKNAAAVYRKIRSRAASLRRFPNRGQIVPELAELQLLTYRQILLSPYRVLYRIEQSTVFVLALLDGRRDLKEILRERFLRP